LREHRQGLHRVVDAREDLRALRDIRKRVAHDVELLEVEERVDTRQQNDEERQHQQVGRTEHDREAGERIATEAAVGRRRLSDAS